MYRALIVTVLFLLPAVPAMAQNLLDGAESVDFDADHNRYLISSYFGGAVVAIDSNGVQSYYQTGFGRAYGLTISQGVLYVSTGTLVRAYDLATDALIFSEIFTSGFVQGVGCDGLGYLYAVDNLGRLVKMDLSDRSQTVLVSAGLPVYPQDVAYDPLRHRLLVVGYAEQSLIMEVDPETGAVTPAAYFELGVYDGICCDRSGNVYMSSGVLPGLVLKWDGEYSHAPSFVSVGHDEPAGTCVNERDSVIAVANFASNSVDYFSFADRDHDDIPAYADKCPLAYDPGQEDVDFDGAGDACDECTDVDGDGFGDPGFPASTCATDNCPGIFNEDQADQDGDGVGDGCDNCLEEPNPDQEDLDGNQIGDACEGCCEGRVGDANGLSGDEPTLGDVSVLIDAVFLSESADVLWCLTEADVNQSGGADPTFSDISLADISVLIDYLFITGSDLVLRDCL